MKKHFVRNGISAIIREMSVEPEEQCNKIADEIVSFLSTRPTPTPEPKKQVCDCEIQPCELHAPEVGEWEQILRKFYAKAWADGRNDENPTPDYSSLIRSLLAAKTGRDQGLRVLGCKTQP